MIEIVTIWWYNIEEEVKKLAINEQEFKARIEYARILANYNKTELANRMNMPQSTFKRKMDSPLRLTIEEFFELVSVLPNGVLIEYIKEEMGIKALKRVPLRRGTVKKIIC